jgi:hypothetical protein
MAVPQECLPTCSKRSANACRSLCGKNPALSTDHYPSLTGQLDYFDSRELRDTSMSKALWPEFENRLGTKEALASRFGQLAELRNGIRHSRKVDEITRIDGEGGPPMVPPGSGKLNQNL